MNTSLWTNILAFEFDTPSSEYRFSTRLASENYWTKNFTDKAILEYKKFMYLAGTSESMVSPSGIIDTVWHQHLIFTQSYSAFCEVIGKQIQHIPSTHTKDDFLKFKQAKERTRTLYESAFGEQPQEIWGFDDMYASLGLPKARFKLRTFLVVGILCFLALLVPFYYLLQPVYLHLDNPNFIIGYIILIAFTFGCLEYYNTNFLSTIFTGFNSAGFMYDLHPSEIVYMQTQKPAQVMHETVSQLIERNKIVVTNNNMLRILSTDPPVSKEEQLILETLDRLGMVYYGTLLRELLKHPGFKTISQSMDACRKYINKSRVFAALYFRNFLWLSLVLMLGASRFCIGLLRQKPVAQLIIVLFFFIIITIFFLHRLTKQLFTYTIPTAYKYKILPARQLTDHLDWQYFLLETGALTASLIPMVRKGDQHADASVSASSSCGSSCGGSCSSSCGGCGGD